MNKLNFKGIISKVFSALIGAFLVVLMIFSSISSTKASATYIVQGDGTSENPFIIETDLGLLEFRDIVNGINNKSRNSNACAILNYNIDLNYHDWSSNDSWTPIGTNSHPYNGTFDGNGYTISRLNVYKADAASLFGCVSGTVKDLTVEGNVRGDGILGGIVGELISGGVVLNCVNHATVINENPSTIGYHYDISTKPRGAGGIVGYNNGGTISNCKNTGTVGVKMNSSGGIASINSGIINNCYNIGYVGGVEPNSGIINSGTIGGIVGKLNEGGYISNSFNYGEISTTYNEQEIVQSGGLVGNRETNTTITNSYCLNNISKTVGAGDSYEDHILTADEFKDSTKFIDWNFTNTVDGVWKMGKKHPILKDELLLVGEGTLASPYQIGTRAEFIKFSDIVNGIRGEEQNLGACATLTSNINLQINNYKEDWKPIAKDDSDNPVSYSGTFNGNNKIISGFVVRAGYEASDKISVGLFANVSGTILNLAVNAVYIDGGQYSRGTGGIAGRLESGGQIINCYNYSVVRASNSENVGGIVGLNRGTVRQCKNCAEVILSYDNYGGGIVGRNYGTVTNCYNVAEVRLYGGCHYLGGIVGYAEEGSTISYTHNQGAVFGYYDGRPIYGDKADNNVTVTSSYYLDTCVDSSMPDGYQAIKLSNTGFLQHMADDNGFTGWDFTNVWENGVSYPVLQNEIELIFINLEGSGTLENPYKIDDKDDLIEFCDIVNGTNGKSQDTNICAKLTSNISIDDIENWTPIGLSDSSAYNGTFDGDGHVIYGLNISSDTGHQGLFGAVSGTIKNLAISGNVKSNNASSDYGTGAIAGHLKTGGTITKCYNYATVYGKYNVGGIVGINEGTISQSKNVARVTAVNECAGGIAGKNNGTITNSYNIGYVRTSGDDSQFAGGITGKTGAASTISNSHNQGKVNGFYDFGPVYGKKEAGATITSTYYKNDNNVTKAGSATGYTSGKFKFQENFTDWNFNATEDGIWKMGKKYPILKNEIEFNCLDFGYLPSIDGNIDGSNGTQKIFVDGEGTTHIIYDHNGKVYYTSTSNDGLYYSTPVEIAEGSGGEIEVSNGRIFVSYLDSSNKPYIAYSDNGSTFTPVCLNNYITVNRGPLHMATYYNNNVVYVYAIPSSGEYFFYSTNSGVSYNTIYGFNPSGYFPTNSDVLVDPNTGKVYVGKSDPENGLMLCESNNNGQDFTDPNLLTDRDNNPIKVPNAVFGFGNSKPNNKPNIYIAGDDDDLYQVNPTTPTLESPDPYPYTPSKIDWPDDGKEGSRTIAADNNGNVVLGFTDSDNNTSYQPGFNDGSFTNFGKPSKLPEAEGGNFAINPNTGGLVYPSNNGENGIKLGEEEGVALVDVPITGIEVSKSTLIIPIGGEAKLDVKTTPSNSLDRSVVWNSSNTSIATVDSVTGIITPVTAGEVVITATKTVELPNEQNVMYMSSCNVTIVESAPSFTHFGNPDLNDLVNDGIKGGYNILDPNTPTPMLDGGWYILDPDSLNDTLTFSDNLPVNGTVNLVVPEGKTLEALNGINVPEGATLNIYCDGQGDNVGGIIASSNGDNAAIGGLAGEDCGTINIHSGDIRTNNSGKGAGIGGGYLGEGGDINLLGGKVTATTSGSGAAIGGGEGADGGNINIKGGSIIANTSGSGAAIGGGEGANGGNINVKDGSIIANTSGSGAAIGGGANGTGGNIKINGGDIDATASEESTAAAIGGGNGGDSGKITINNGDVDATTSGSGAAIGGGSGANGGNITINGGDVDAISTASSHGAAIGGGNGTTGTGGDITINGGEVDAISSGSGAAIGGGDGANGGNVIIDINNAIGSVNAISNGDAAAIGGGKNGTGGDIVLNDGEINATSNGNGAAIGGGSGANGGTITIKDGDIYALNISSGAAIGGGSNGNGGSITIDGGYVKAETIKESPEDSGGAAIGGGSGANGGTIAINNGEIYAMTDGDGAAIGGGNLGSSGNIDILGGRVIAVTAGDGAAIGGGNEGIGDAIHIGGGNTFALSDGAGASIGGGKNGGAGAITISGGETNALNASTGAAIGSGENAEGEVTGSINISGGKVRGQNTSTSAGGAGIGGGKGSNGINVTVTGGAVSAIGGEGASAIGAGNKENPNNGTLTVTPADYYIFDGATSDEGIIYESPSAALSAKPRHLNIKAITTLLVSATDCSTYYGENLATYPYTVSMDSAIVTDSIILNSVASRVNLVSNYSIGNDTGLYTVGISNNGYDTPYILGEYFFQISFTGATLTVNKATVKMTKAPSGKTGLTYKGIDQELVSLGTINGGTFKYSLDGINYSYDIPMGLSVGDYVVYYYVEGNNNFLDLTNPNFSFIATINKAPLVIAADNKTVKFNEEATNFSITPYGLQNGETLADFEGIISFSCNYRKGNNVGNYNIIPSGLSSDKYEITYRSGTLSVVKADPNVNIVPKAIKNLVYNGQSQELITGGMSVGGDVYYKLDDGEWSLRIPTKVNAGEYEIYYKIIGDSNHNDMEPSSWHFTATINEASVTNLVVPEVKTDLEYNGHSQDLISVGSVEHGTVWYKVDDGEYSTTVPKATNVGTYTVYYQVIAEENYSDIAEVAIKVTIAEVDKSDLINEIDKANDLYDEIKDDYPTIASDLGEVIDKANIIKNNPNVLDSEVSDAIVPVTNGIDKAKVDVVSEKIKAIGDVKYNDETKELIDEAREAYNKLTPTQKGNVKDSLLDQLIQSENDYNAVDNVNNMISEIGDVKYDDESKSLIDNANEAYNDLTSNQKQILPEKVKDTLDKANDDYDSVDDFVNSVNDIGKVNYTDASKSLIDNAKELYEELTQEQKEITPSEAITTLEKDEELYYGVDEFVNKVNEIGDVEYNLTTKGLINDATEALNSLSSEQLEIVPKNVLDTLEQAENDYEAVKEVVEEIDKIKEVLYNNETKSLIDSANDLYDSLSEKLKNLVPTSVITKLEKASDKYDAMDTAVSKISSIGDVSYTVASHKAIEEAKKAYDSLTEEEKALIPTEQVEALNDAIDDYNELEDSSDRTNLKDEETKVSIEASDNTPIPDDITLKVDVKVEASIQLEELVEVVPHEEIVLENEEIVSVYDVKLVRTTTDAFGNVVEEEIQPGDIKEGTIVIVRMAIPNNIKGEDFKVLHIHSDEDLEYVEYEVEGKEILIHVDRLSKFAFVANKDDVRRGDGFCLGWISFIVLILSIGLIAAYYYFKLNKLYGYIGAGLALVSFILALIEVCISGCAISIITLILSILACGGIIGLYLLDRKIIE